MNLTEMKLNDHHQKFNHLNQIRIDLRYSELAKSSNQSQLAIQDVKQLLERLFKRQYITSYIWTMGFTQEKGLHAHILLYLNDEQSDVLAILAAEQCWLHLTADEGFIEELDVEQDVVAYLAQESAISLFKANPERFIGVGE